MRRVVEACLGAALDPVYVITGHDRPRVCAALADLPVSFIWNPEYHAGQSYAVQAGIRELGDRVNAAVIGVGDQPLLTADVVRRLVTRWRESHAPIVAPRYAGRRGTPVLFSRELFPDLLRIEGDEGARSVISAHNRDVEYVDIEDVLVGADIDTAEDLDKLRRHVTPL